MNGRWNKAGSVLAVVALLSGCFPMAVGQRTGRVRLVLHGGNEAKTILPTVSVNSYVIHFEASPISKPCVDTAEANPVVELAVGTWDITVEGKDNEGWMVARGIATGLAVMARDTTVVAIELVA